MSRLESKPCVSVVVFTDLRHLGSNSCRVFSSPPFTPNRSSRSSPATSQSAHRRCLESPAMSATLPPQAAPRTDPRQKVSRSATSQSGSVDQLYHIPGGSSAYVAIIIARTSNRQVGLVALNQKTLPHKTSEPPVQQMPEQRATTLFLKPQTSPRNMQILLTRWTSAVLEEAVSYPPRCMWSVRR